MALFKKKKPILEEPPGFPELKRDIPQIEEPKIESKVFKEIDMPDLPEIEEQEEPEEIEEMESEELEDEEQKELTEIPGLKERESEKSKKSTIPELKKELPKKISVDIKDAHENPAKIYKRNKDIKQIQNIEREHRQKTRNNHEEDDKSIFVKIEDFNNVTFSLNEIKNKLKLIEGDISELKSLKSREDSEIMAWEQEIISIKEKLLNINKILSNKNNQ